MDLPAVGDRIELIAMPNDPDPIEPGTTGTVTNVQSGLTAGTHDIWVDWDAPRSLSLIAPPDQFRIIDRVSARQAAELIALRDEIAEPLPDEDEEP